MELKLTNNVTKKEWTFDVTDNNTSRLFYAFDITLPEDIDEGEYSYVLSDGDIVKGTGLCQVGNYIPDNNVYTAQTTGGYIQYNPD